MLPPPLWQAGKAWQLLERQVDLECCAIPASLIKPGVERWLKSLCPCQFTHPEGVGVDHNSTCCNTLPIAEHYACVCLCTRMCVIAYKRVVGDQGQQGLARGGGIQNDMQDCPSAARAFPSHTLLNTFTNTRWKARAHTHPPIHITVLFTLLMHCVHAAARTSGSTGLHINLRHRTGCVYCCACCHSSSSQLLSDGAHTSPHDHPRPIRAWQPALQESACMCSRVPRFKKYDSIIKTGSRGASERGCSCWCCCCCFAPCYEPGSSCQCQVCPSCHSNR